MGEKKMAATLQKCLAQRHNKSEKIIQYLLIYNMLNCFKIVGELVICEGIMTGCKRGIMAQNITKCCAKFHERIVRQIIKSHFSMQNCK